LQRIASAAQVQCRVHEQYGERETVSRRVRYVLCNFVDWQVIKKSSKKGVCKTGSQHAVDDPQLIAWLTEASLFVNMDILYIFDWLKNEKLTIFPIYETYL
jgi:hypothetical protein